MGKITRAILVLSDTFSVENRVLSVEYMNKSYMSMHFNLFRISHTRISECDLELMSTNGYVAAN